MFTTSRQYGDLLCGQCEGRGQGEHEQEGQEMEGGGNHRGEVACVSGKNMKKKEESAKLELESNL